MRFSRVRSRACALEGVCLRATHKENPSIAGIFLLYNSPPECYTIHLFRSSLRWGFRRLRAATIGASRPPRPPRQSSRALQPHFWIGDFHSFGEGNKVGSCRRQLLGNRRSRLSTRRLSTRFSYLHAVYGCALGVCTAWVQRLNYSEGYNLTPKNPASSATLSCGFCTP